jgi:predicted protein tyrosine phosphatase
MPTIHVCPLHLVPDESRRLQPSRLVTLLSPSGAMPERPAYLKPEQHLTRLFNDIDAEIDDLIAPSQHDVQAVIDFARAWPRDAPMLIHCYAGISRSTAAALIAAIAINPDLDDAALAQALREASPSAKPNIRMISMADEMLGRGGRLIDAVMDMSIGELAPHGQPFQLVVGE